MHSVVNALQSAEQTQLKRLQSPSVPPAEAHRLLEMIKPADRLHTLGCRA